MAQPVNEQNMYNNLLYDVFVSDTSAVKVKAIRIHKPDDTYNLRLHVENNGKLDPPLEFPFDKLRTKILEISNFSVQFTPIEISEIIQGIRNDFLKQSLVPTLDAFDKLGWHYNENNNVDYWKSAIGVDLQGKRLVKDIYAPYPSYAGDLQANMDYIKDYISRHGAVAQSIVLYGFSAILAGYFRKNLLLSLSGKSSTGKTTISKMLVSLFAEPENTELSTTFNATLNKMSERLDRINGATVIIDDLSLASSSVKKEIDNLLYILAGGDEKGRMKTKSFTRDPATWFTTIIFSAEESILDLCNPEQEGVVGRLMELNIGKHDLFSDANEANLIKELSHKHYGLIADEFIKSLILNNKLKDLASLYKEETRRVQKNYSNVMARIAENVAIITLCGELLNELFSFQFDIANVEKYLMSTAKENLVYIRELQKGNEIIDIIYPRLIAYAKKSCSDLNKKSKGYVIMTGEATKQILKEIQDEFGYKPIQIKRALKNNGLLKATDGFTYVNTIGGKSFRGTYLYDKDINNLEDIKNDE